VRCVWGGQEGYGSGGRLACGGNEGHEACGGREAVLGWGERGALREEGQERCREAA